MNETIKECGGYKQFFRIRCTSNCLFFIAVGVRMNNFIFLQLILSPPASCYEREGNSRRENPIALHGAESSWRMEAEDRLRTEMTASEGEGPSRIETGHRWRTMSACHLTGMVESPNDQRRDDSGTTAHSRRFVEMRGIPRGTM